jgi:hypothetical protein
LCGSQGSRPWPRSSSVTWSPTMFTRA